MGIFIKNPQVERKARELARLKQQSLTAVIEQALDRQLADLPPSPPRELTLAEMEAVTERFRKSIGLDKARIKPMTKKDWDHLWPTGIREIDEA